MDEYQILALLSKIEPGDADLHRIKIMLAETLSEVSDRLNDDQMRRLLICSAYLYHRANCTSQEIDAIDRHEAMRSRMQMN
ncbi:hypothetical protein [Noviherbaspirillum aerium]|uniref:hypothetical protein n=1 Tax=Noviherbaspirillum aerium TaxID=2588497 RepID=UPI00124DA2D3|nr:hypothetical protein [Noviherbaspirillum aerium]